MGQPRIDAAAVSGMMTGATVTFGIPAYNEAEGVLPTLDSLWQGMSKLGIANATVILSDSSDRPGLSSAESAWSWARTVGANLTVDRSDHRRSLKESLNVLLARADTDVFVSVNADVIVPTQSLVAMFYYLFAEPRPAAAIGSALPDPASSDLKSRAGAWQMRTVWRAATLASPSIGQTSVRSEGAFWGAWRSFYSNYRYPIGHGSINDDVELTRALVVGGFPCRNAVDAFVYKIPPSTEPDLCSGTLRFRAGSPQHHRGANEYAAALFEGLRDPIGAVLYGRARVWCWRNHDLMLGEAASEQWRVLDTTKRRKKS
jgi:hypothetical protein